MTHRRPNALMRAVWIALAAAIIAPRAVHADIGYLPHLRQGTDLLSRDLVRQAEEEFAAANYEDHADPLGWVGWGAARLARGQVDSALAKLEGAAELAAAGSQQAQTVAPLAHFGRAVCLLQRGQVAAARKQLSQLVQDGFAWAEPTLAYAELAAGNRVSARTHAQAVLERFPQDPLALAVLGRTLPPAQGIPRLRQALDLLPGSPYVAPLTALALPNRSRPTIARELVRIEIRGAPEHTAVITWLGEESTPDYILLRIDDSIVGMSNTRPHVFELPHDLGPGPHGLVAEACSGRRVLGRGTAVLWPASSESPENGYDGDQYAAALEALRATLMPLPNRVQVHYWLAAACAAAGDQGSALANYERVVALDADFADARQRLVALCKVRGRIGSKRAVSEAPDKRIYLTFDDGPNPMFTGRILDTLREARVRATFFVVGTQARAYPELVQAIAAAGHEIANHSYSHDDMTTKSAAEIQQELLRTQAVVEDATGQRPHLFRPPGGKHDSKVRTAAAQVGYTTVLWSASVGTCAGMTPQRGVARLLQDIGPGAIVLLHNGPDESADILPGLLAALKRKGYSFGTLSQALHR